MLAPRDSGFKSSGIRPARPPDILLVDDDSDVREALVGALEDEGYSVAEAADGSSALDQLKTAPIPHLIILDLSMPRLAGADFRRETLKDPELGVVPVLVVSADPDARERAQAMGAQGFLAKPVGLADLFETVARLLGTGRARGRGTG